MIKHIKKTFTPKSAVKPNQDSQSYQHMMGQITDPQDHPAYNMPDPAGSRYGSANPPSADQQDMYEQQG
jgi:hypothetical protein